MRKNIKLILIVILSIPNLLSCLSSSNAVSSDMEKQFLRVVGIANMNDSLQLKVDGDINSFILGSRIPLLIFNESSDSIFFTGDSYVKLFMIKDGEWSEVRNELTYSGSKTLSPKGTLLLDQSTTWAKPALTEEEINNNEKDIPVRIVIIGEVVENNIQTGEFVGAYVDVTISI